MNENFKYIEENELDPAIDWCNLAGALVSACLHWGFSQERFDKLMDSLKEDYSRNIREWDV